MRKYSYKSLMALIAVSSIQIGCGMFKKSKSALVDPSRGFTLTGDEAKHFEDWKKAPIKSCLTENAFEGKAGEADQRGIDLKVLFEKSGNSLVLLNAESFVMFGVPYGLSGEGTSQLSRSTQINNTSDSFGAKMTRKGSQCIVEVNGEKVYETYLFSSVPVVVHGQGAISEPVAKDYYLTQTDQGLVGHGLLSAFFDTNVRKSQLLVQLKTFFADWSDEDLNKYFVNGSNPGSFIRHVAELVDMDNVPPFNGDFPQIPSTVPGLQTLAAASGDLVYKLSMPVTRISYGDITNSKDQGLWQLQVGVEWKKSAQLTSAAYSVTSLTWQDQIPEDSNRLVDCFHARLNAFKGLRLFGEGTFSPSYSGVSGPCSGFASDPDAALFTDAKLRTHMANLFAGKSKLEQGVAYLGWDEALKGFALHALDVGEDFAKAFDPANKSLLISTLGAYVKMVGAEAEKHEFLKSSKAFYAASLALPWASSGRAVQQNFVADLMSSIANVAEIFSDSVSSWMSDLAKDPESQSAQIDYAGSVSEDTKIAMKDYLAKVDAANMRSVVGGSKLQRIIQDRTDIAANLPAWNATLDALAAFRARDSAKADEFGQMTYDRDFKDIAELSVKEDWSEADFTQIDKIAQLAKKKSFCDSKSATVSLMNCIGDDGFTRKDGGFLAPAFAGRYSELAGEFSAHHDKLEDSEFVFIRQKLVDNFYNPVWKACDNATFASNRTTLSGLVNQALNAQFPDSFEIKNKIEDLLDACD